MSKRQLLIVLGVWVIVFLFLHFPSTWDKIFAVVTGLLIIIIAFKFKVASRAISAGQVPYVEYKSSTKPRTDVESEQKIQDMISPKITNTDLPTAS